MCEPVVSLTQIQSHLPHCHDVRIGLPIDKPESGGNRARFTPNFQNRLGEEARNLSSVILLPNVTVYSIVSDRSIIVIKCTEDIE